MKNGDLFGSIRGGVSGMDKSYPSIAKGRRVPSLLLCWWRQQVIRRKSGGLITKTVLEEGCVSVRWHIERRKRLAKGRAFLLE